MTVANLYTQLKEGKITESKFLYEVRRDSNLPFITNLTSFKDAEQILKNKGIIKEWAKDDKEVIAIIDKLNPYRFKRAMYAELGKLGDVDEPTYIKVREKVARKMAADPMAYREEEFMNSKDIEKQDAKLQMQPVSKGLKHEGQPMTKIKGQETLKAHRAPKTENKKGKPKGVKELTYHAKKVKGIAEVMPETKKEKIVESLFGDLFKKKVKLTEDTHHRFGQGQSVPLPQKDRDAFGCDSGTIKDIKGGTLYLELEVTDEQGQPLQISRQINAIEHELGGKPEMPKEQIKEPVINDEGNAFTTGQEVIDDRGNKVRIDGFKKDRYGKIEALIKASTGMFYQGVNIDGLSPIKSEEKPESDKEYRDRVFGKLPNVGGTSIRKEDKLKELFSKLKEVSKKNLKEAKKKVKKENIDPKTLAAAQAGKTTLSVKKGSNDERQAQQKGLTYTSY
jgi:hypothetical protein